MASEYHILTFARFLPWLFVTIGSHYNCCQADYKCQSKLQTFKSHLSSLQEVSIWYPELHDPFCLHIFQVLFSFLPHSCLYSHAGLFSFFFCFPDHISAPLVLGTLNSSRLLIGHHLLTVQPTLPVHQWGSCRWGPAAVSQITSKRCLNEGSSRPSTCLYAGMQAIIAWSAICSGTHTHKRS